ncbi:MULTISPECIES: cysteine hydrolase [unclassified Devosia]|uniref:cysteine hydrolase family protein n=1 Tax=unclassified Devosia TaxID=196773 RepID=UPI00145DD04C|nr:MULTISPECIES: cysteine hydrolase [unclassified Devosia]MBJ6989191.1 cysteine hydrolase [Devosia sp. MC521]QMW62454.1 cysteine hydrolase [Devosia sp. MC521]
MAEHARLAHLCVDVQNMFAVDTDWQTPWLNRVLPCIEAIVERAPAKTVFTRFIPPSRPEEEIGTWHNYYLRWPAMVRSRLSPYLLQVVPTLARHMPPARHFDKNRYSPWLFGGLDRALRADGIDTLIISGGETDVCVMATTLGAVDLGYRTILVTDAVFGSANQTHDAALTVLQSRFGQQLSACTTQELLDNWKDIT